MMKSRRSTVLDAALTVDKRYGAIRIGNLA
jgi:hypothetical protein